MANFNGRMYLLSALYHVRGRFSNLPNFMKQVGSHFSSLPYDRDLVLEKVQQLQKQFLSIQEPISDNQALNLMISEDLYEVQAVLRNDAITQKIDSRSDIEEILYDCRDTAVNLLQKKGVNIIPPPLIFVDQLSSPYIQRGYSAFTADVGDKEKYGIKPGVYFPKGRMRPFYSEFLLLHELIHVIFGKTSPFLLARGLEEGLAELIGAMYLSSKVLGKELTINLFIYNRLSNEYSRFWELYLDATRQATLLHQRFGLQGVMAMLNMGREELKGIEKHCFLMEFDEIKLPQGEIDRDLSDISDFLSLAFSRNLIVSPLARYLSYYVHPNLTVAEILAAARVDGAAGRRALKELEDRVNLISFSDDIEISGNVTVNWTDCERLCEGTTIRYEIPTTSQK